VYPVPYDPRSAVLDAAVASHVQVGWAVESRSPTMAVMVSHAASPNHVLHLLLSLVTCGLWLVVWLLVAVTSSGRTRRVALTVGPNGEIVSTQY
jgi:hypothetical protein